MSVRPRKTRVYMTLQQQSDILQKLEDGFPRNQLAKDYNISDTTIRRIKSNAVNIRKTSQIPEFQGRKKMRKPVLVELDACLYSWFLQQRAIDDCITDLVLQKKAIALNEELGGPSSFSACAGWIWRFKRRHGIRFLKLHRESATTNIMAAEEFSRNFQQRLKMENIELRNVYNMDETGLMWKAVPQKSLIHAGERKITGNIKKKDQVTVGLCANATGTHKLPPIFINKYERPRVLKHCRDPLPVIFKAQKNGFMDQNVFADWLENHFKPAVRKHQLEDGTYGKVLLLLHNYEGHVLSPEEKKQDDNIEIVYFPVNTTSILQPMGQGIIETMKTSYRHRMLRKIVEFPGGVEEFYKKYDIKDCINILNEVWVDMTQTIICKSWEKILANEVIIKQETQEDQEERSPFIASTVTGIPDTVKTIVEETVPREEVEESFTGYSEIEDDSKVRRYRGNDKFCLEPRPHLDEIEINRMFKNLVLWSQRQPKFIKIQVQALQDFYQYTRR